MSLTAAASGFVVFLLSVQVIQGQSGLGVIYPITKVCALKGSTVEIRCTISYPPRINGRDTAVKETFWFTKLSGNEAVDLRTDSQYAGRVQYSCYEKSCTLRITDLRESDSAEYKFMFITNQPGGSYAGSPGVTLSVTEFKVQVERRYSGWTELKCHSSCLPYFPSYVWYKNGQKIQATTSSSYSGYFDPADSFSCAIKGREDFPSPSVCVVGQSCNRVTYTNRNICALKGSSVDISCTYNSYGSITSKFWFSPQRVHQWQSPSQPEDLSEDSQYAGRVQVLNTEGGRRSTLRITDLTERDSAEYHFKFKTGVFEWNSILPGTTLTVTALQVQVTKVTVHQSHTEAELKCHSSCSPAAHFSYVWFKNGQKVMGKETSSYTDDFYPGDNICCAFKGHEDYCSPSLYPSKLPSVSVSPSGEIAEGSSVTLSCRIDADPSAKTTWYKENQTLSLGSSGVYHFTSISSEDRGIYHCKSEDKHSVSLFIDVQYGPQRPSVSVSPSAEIVEGSSVTLTCSSDANPAANYTWYKENEDSPKASGQNFTITNIRAEHSGNYYCEAQNSIGRHNSTLHLIVVAVSPLWNSATITNIIRFTLVAVMLIPLLLFFLWMRKKKTLSSNTEPNEPIETVELESGPDCFNVSALNSVAAAQTEDTEEQEHFV